MVWYSRLHSIHYRSFLRRLYGSNDPTNSVTTLKDDGYQLVLGEAPCERRIQTRLGVGKNGENAHFSNCTLETIEDMHIGAVED